MTWTYAGDPSVSDLAAVRFLVGDTDTTDQLITDEEINYLITEHGMTYHAASATCRAISAKYARLMQRSIGGLSADFAAKYRQYGELADALMEKSDRQAVSLYASGWKKAAKEAIDDDTDREQIFGRKGGMDNQRANATDEYYPATYRNY